MSGMEIAWSVVGILAPVVVGVGFAVLTLPTAEFRAARACFILSAFMLVSMAAYWSLQTDASAVRLWIVNGAIGVGVCTFLPAGLLWISKHQRVSKEPPGSAPREESLPLVPRITALTPIVRQAYQNADGVVHLGRGPVETGMQTMRHAILAPFKNTAKAGVQTRDAKDVSASVIFKDADGWPITGAWLESTTHKVDIPMGAPEQRVILVFAEQGGGAFLLDDERQGVAEKITRIAFCSYPKHNEPPPPDFAIRVELMEGGHLVLEAEYTVRITLPYPQASLTSASYPAEQLIGEPDVSLRFQLPNHFELHNYGGDATDVSIQTVTIDRYVSEIWDSSPMTTPEQTVRFPVREIDGGKSEDISPIFTHNGIGLGPSLQDMVGFINELIKRRKIDALGAAGFPQPDKSMPEESLAYFRESLKLQTEPVEIEMKLSFRSRETGRRWEKIETLHYDPQIGSAHVSHGRQREVFE